MLQAAGSSDPSTPSNSPIQQLNSSTAPFRQNHCLSPVALIAFSEDFPSMDRTVAGRVDFRWPFILSLEIFCTTPHKPSCMNQ